MYGYNQYNPNSQSPFPDPGTILPAGQTIDVIYAQSYAQTQQQPASVDNRYDPVGTNYYNQSNTYGQTQSQDYYSSQPNHSLTQSLSSHSVPHQYESESSQRFQINPSYANAVHLDGVPAPSSYNTTPNYGSNELYNSSDYPTQQYTTPPPGAPVDSYPPTSQYNNNTSYQSDYYPPPQSSFSDSAYSSTIQQPGQSQPTQWQPTQSAPTVQWHLPHSEPPSAQSFYPAPGTPPISHASTSNLPIQPNTNVPAYQSNANVPYQSNANTPAYQSNANTSAYQSNANIAAYQSNTNLPYNTANPPVKQQSPQMSNPSWTGPPTQNNPQGSPVVGSSVQSPPVSSAQNKLQQLALTEEREKMEKERAELLKQQQLMQQRQDELRKQEEALKAMHVQEELKLRSEIEKQREEVAKMKAELAKQSSEQQLQQAQKDKVIEVQKGEMQRQMDELMKERELVKKHEEEMRNALLEEQRLMLQQLKQQQQELAQQQQAVHDHARQAEQQRQLEHQHKLEVQRKQEEDLLRAKQAIDQQQQALQRQMQEAKEAARKMEEAQRAANEQQQKVAAQQKQTEEQRRLAEEKRKQVEEQYQKTLWAQKQQQEAFAKQENELRQRQEQLNAEQERVRNINREAESKIEADKRQMAERIQAQQRTLQQQQDDIKRQQELVTLQQKELLVKKREQQEAAEKEKASASVKDLLAPMRNSANGWQSPKSPMSPAGATQIGAHSQQPPPKPISTQPQQPPYPSKAPAKPLSPPPPKPQSPAQPPAKIGERRDSRMLPNLNLNQVVDGYKLGDIVRAQRYVRRWLMRKHFVKLVQQYRSSDDKTAEKLRHRNKALHEIYTSELSYVASLQLLSNFYVVPMQVESMVKQTFTDKDAQIIFSSAQTLLDVSKGLVAELEARLDKWPSVQLFGDIFVRLAPVMKLYAEYINNFDAANVRLKALLSTPEGLQFFENCKAKSRSQLDINSLLIMPVQRVPRYELLLRELIKFTEESHVDFANLNAAFKAIHQVNTYINQKKKDVDSRQKLTAIQNAVKGCPNLMLAHRYYAYEGNLQVSSTDKHKSGMFYFFLFNDMLMACKKAGGLFHRHEYEYVFSIDLNSAVVKRVSENVMFRVMTGGLEDINVAIYTFLCQNQTEKEAWMKQFVSIEEGESGNSKKLLVRDASVSNFQR